MDGEERVWKSFFSSSLGLWRVIFNPRHKFFFSLGPASPLAQSRSLFRLMFCMCGAVLFHFGLGWLDQDLSSYQPPLRHSPGSFFKKSKKVSFFWYSIRPFSSAEFQFSPLPFSLFFSSLFSSLLFSTTFRSSTHSLYHHHLIVPLVCLCVCVCVVFCIKIELQWITFSSCL